MITLIYEDDGTVRTVNQNELEQLHNIPKGYTSILNQKKAQIAPTIAPPSKSKG